MNLHPASSLIVLCYLITTMRGNVLIDGKSSSCDCDHLVDELRQDLQVQQEQIGKLAEVQQEQHKLILLLLKLESRKYEQDMHQISKREVPSTEDSNDYHDQLLSQLGCSAPGRDGRDGKNGENGRDGRDGKEGKDGNNAPGRDGRDGKDGEEGRNGNDGQNGSNGRDGEAGDTGATGLPGVSGPKGEAGDTGATGVTGPLGASGPPGPTVKNAIEVLRGGVVFTRWGRTTCGLHSTLIYEGFAGNTHYNQPGGGSNYQCLPLDPEYHDYKGSVTNKISGVEYESDSYGLFPNSAHDQNVPCARCYTENRTAVMMIPAKRTCPDDWTEEYEGYLMSAHEGHPHTSTFECVDAEPEYIAGHHGNTNGGLLYFVKPYCSGTSTIGHCPPYYADRELTCVVCTK